MTIKIEGPAPQLGLNITDFSHRMNADGHCLSWCTVDPADLTIVDDHIVAIAPRAGTFGLETPEFSVGPALSEASGFPSAFHARDVLDYLAFESPLDGSCFSIVAICETEELIKTAQNVFAIGSRNRSVKLLREGERFIVKIPGKDQFTGENEWTQQGVFMAIMSVSDGMMRLRFRDASLTGEIAQLEFENPNTAPSQIVFAADHVATIPDSPTPSAPRSWRGHFHDMLTFDNDILRDGPALALLDQYFAEVYLGHENND